MPLTTFHPETLSILPPTQTRRPTILLVDDDTGVRRFLHSVLRRATNAHVVDVPDTIEAMHALQSMAAPPDVLLTDVDLGGGPSGLHLAAAVARQSRTTRIVLMSGDPTNRKGLQPQWRFLSKPFTIEAFVGVMKECLTALRQTSTL